MRVRSSDGDKGTSVEAITHARFVELFRMQNMPMRSIIASRTIWCFVRYNWNEIKLIQWLLFMRVRIWYVIVIEKLATSPGFTRVSIIFLCLLADKLLASHTGISTSVTYTDTCRFANVITLFFLEWNFGKRFLFGFFGLDSYLQYAELKM